MDRGVEVDWYKSDRRRGCTAAKQERFERAGFAASKALDTVVGPVEVQKGYRHPGGLFWISIRRQDEHACHTFTSSKIKARGQCGNGILLHLSGDHVSVLVVVVADGFRI